MKFEARHCGSLLTLVNPQGTAGLLTLWSRPDYVLRELREAGCDLSPETSPIAAVGTLYGNGLRELLRNLLWNPQIDTLFVYGRDCSGSLDDLLAFFGAGLEDVEGSPVAYGRPEGFPEPRPVRIRGRGRILDSLVAPADFERPPRIVPAGSPEHPEDLSRLANLLAACRPAAGPLPERRAVPLPAVRVTFFPSHPAQHSIIAGDALTAWRDLIFRLHRFGAPVRLAKGGRRELLNVKVVVANPAPVAPEDLAAWGFDPARVARYGEEILDGDLHGDETYTYGNRLRAHFGLDALLACAARLRDDPEDRKAYVSLWDTPRDLPFEKGHPCLVSVFFRRVSGKLSLTACFRTHNALDAWLVNFHGLLAVRDFVTKRCGMEGGPMTLISHSVSLDERELDRAGLIAAKQDFRFTEDPCGYFRITLDGDAILVEQRSGDVTLTTYRAAKASRLKLEIARDCALSDLNHAIYLGMELARAEACLKNGVEYVQE